MPATWVAAASDPEDYARRWQVDPDPSDGADKNRTT